MKYIRFKLLLKIGVLIILNINIKSLIASRNNSIDSNQNNRSARVLADKIVTFVGDKYILHSDIQNFLADYKRQAQNSGIENLNIPEPCQVLENLIIKKIFVLQAQRDSLPVSEEEVDAALDNRIRSFIYQYGSKEILEEVANRSVYQIKEDFREPIREQKLAESMQNKIVEGIKITPIEVQEFYNKIPKDSLLVYEAELELSQLQIHPKASLDVEVYVSRQLNDFKRQIETGIKNIDYFIKEYSDDPAARENKGQYLLNRGDKNWDPAFFNAAFRLKVPGQVSPIIKSKFGFHIIQLVSKSGEDIVIKHILRIPPITKDEVDAVRLKLDTIRQEILANKINFNEAVNKYSDDENTKFTAGAILDQRGSALVTIDVLDRELVLALKNLKPGEISQPLDFVDERGRKGLRLIYFKDRIEPHKENLKDDYNKISQRVLESKRQAAVEEWIKHRTKNFYILVSPEYKGCSEIKKLL